MSELVDLPNELLYKIFDHFRENKFVDLCKMVKIDIDIESFTEKFTRFKMEIIPQSFPNSEIHIGQTVHFIIPLHGNFMQEPIYINLPPIRRLSENFPVVAT